MLLCLLCACLSGCSQASQVENHAYVLVMGLDRMQDGQLEMTVLVPKISGGQSESSGGQSGSDSYTKFVIRAADYEDAISRLNWASPRDVTLSQIKLIVFSRELAEDAQCRELIENIAQTERLYTAAKVAVCEGKARDFVEAVKPNIGTHVSMDIDAMYEHYTSSGYVPNSSLAELYYQTESIYSDPMVTYALLNQEAAEKADKESAPAVALYGSVQEVSDAFESDIATRYLGAAVFSGGRLAGTLNGNQTVMANLLRNEAEAIRYACGGQTLNMVPARATFIKVDVSGERPKISINMHLSLAAQERHPDMQELKESMEADIRDTIQRAKDMQAEPFGFAEKAARKFLTIEQWLQYDWQKRFQEAEIEIDLKFTHSDA